jgi:outer membrane murein-binding lipoprotein Lpp
MEPDTHTSTTARLKVLAPAAALWPSWWRRNLTPGALYIIGAVVLAAVVTVTTFIATAGHDRNDMLELKSETKDIARAIGQIQSDISAMKQWQHDVDEAAKARNPYVRPSPPPHGKPAK